MTCHDRDEEAAKLWRHFARKQDVLMLAPRRMGKTILLNRLREESESKGYHAIVLDVEGYREEKAFFQQMCASIQEEIGTGQALLAALTERLRRVVQGADLQDGDWRNLLLSMEWHLFADHLLAQLEKEKDGPTWLFLVDEITIFTKALVDAHGAQRASDFLYTLRRLCRAHSKVRWLYTGSIGLDTIARRNGFEGALVDLVIFPLEPFGEPIARDFVREIATGREVVITDDAVEVILQRLGWLSPYYLEKITHVACDLAVEGRATTKEADAAAESLLALCHRTYWSTWREHLDKNFPEPERTRLFTILAAAAQAPGGVTMDTLLTVLNTGGETLGEEAVREHLDTLEADGYLCADGVRSRFRFRMSLLRDWWLRYVAVLPSRGPRG
jgi:hypothetical protein